LIEEVSGTWIPKTVNAFFDTETAEKILQVQIDRHGGKDFVYWPLSKHGTYTVRSAYNMARSSNFFLARSSRGRGLTSTYTDDQRSWKAIWKINAPNKMKIHLWRFAHDCLSSGSQLIRRQIPADGACIFCGREEDIEHTLLFCQFAQDVWRSIKSVFNFKLNKDEFVSTKTWLFDFLSKATDLEATILTVVFWHIWEARNDVRNNQAQPDPRCTSAKSLAYVDMIVQHCYKPNSDHRRETTVTRKWFPPPPG
jgi:hypothetical protein